MHVMRPTVRLLARDSSHSVLDASLVWERHLKALGQDEVNSLNFCHCARSLWTSPPS